MSACVLGRLCEFGEHNGEKKKIVSDVLFTFFKIVVAIESKIPMTDPKTIS